MMTIIARLSILTSVCGLAISIYFHFSIFLGHLPVFERFFLAIIMMAIISIASSTLVESGSGCKIPFPFSSKPDPLAHHGPLELLEMVGSAYFFLCLIISIIWAAMWPPFPVLTMSLRYAFTLSGICIYVFVRSLSVAIRVNHWIHENSIRSNRDEHMQ